VPTPGEPIILTLTPEEGLALLNDYSNPKRVNKQKGKDSDICNEKTPFNDDH